MENSAQQLELFSATSSQAQQAGLRRYAWLGYARGHEKIILAAIAFIITAVISFSLGVEKGKLVALRAVNPVFDLALKAKPGSNKPAMRIAKAIPANINTMAAAGPANSANRNIINSLPQPALATTKPAGYTIQLASYQNKGSAVKEAERLKKKGLTALVVAKGNYNILCVGSFNSKETAKPLLSELKKKYQDSFIRRL